MTTPAELVVVLRFDYNSPHVLGRLRLSVAADERLLADMGFTLRRRDFSYPSYCVFHLLECPD